MKECDITFALLQHISYIVCCEVISLFRFALSVVLTHEFALLIFSINVPQNLLAKCERGICSKFADYGFVFVFKWQYFVLLFYCSIVHAVRTWEMLVQVTAAEKPNHRRQRLHRLLQVSQAVWILWNVVLIHIDSSKTLICRITGRKTLLRLLHLHNIW